MAWLAAKNRSIGTGKVVHVIGALAAGGAERFVVSLVSELASRGLGIELWVMSNRREPVTLPMLERLKRANINVILGPTLKAGLGTIAWYAKQLRRAQPRVVHLHTPNTELLHALAAPVARWNGVKIRTLHSTATPGSGFQKHVFQNSHYDVTVACGRSVFEKFSVLGVKHIVEIANGVEFGWEIQSADLRSQARKDTGLQQNKRVFVCIGRMDGPSPAESQKGHDTLIAAWRQCELGRALGELHMLGDGPLRPELERLAGKEDNVFFHGIQADPAKWLLAANIFVMPSRWEGLPIAGIEGIGTGIPCVLSSISTLEELGPPTAWWFEPDDVCGLSAALESAYENLVTPSAAAVEKFRQRFSIGTCANRYASLYEIGNEMEPCRKMARHGRDHE